MSDRNEEISQRSADLQQRWHGWGSPVGVGILIVSLATAIFLLALSGWLFA